MSPSPVMMFVCDDLPLSDEFPDHTDSDTSPKHLVEYRVASRDKFAAVAHDISQNTGRAGQSMSNGIDDCLHDLRSQSTSSRNIREGNKEDIGGSDEAACGKRGFIDGGRDYYRSKDGPFFRAVC